ncbi:WbqC family protein [Pseudoalteromonas denitrificans]|uniref:WbqC-like protein family protein n=1 Tax=Pseudoalteromonas denitrificans DSM 6059 TaxID=1123010 RepID=A0A1I1HJQ0_9GAMM|nr:WbqC family protein [Pseudoalteromonas denitrificans]SFC24297.1 WbqC-like protein family protein [Pseudoalteromonas denitrificans DSM 6059]
MITSINQPAYLPWLGYFERISNSTQHIVLDHVQFEKNSMVNRNKIKTAQGWCWLTIPLKTSGKFGDLALNKIEVNNTQKWQKKHWNSLYFNYKKSPFFALYAEELNHFYEKKWELLSDILKWQLTFFLNALEIKTPIIYSSEYDFQTTKSDLVLDICKNFKTQTYLSGPFGRDYLESELFIKNNINIAFHDYKHPTYQQMQGDFISHLCILDLLCNYGSNSINILKTQNIGHNCE